MRQELDILIPSDCCRNHAEKHVPYTERVPVKIFETPAEASECVARRIADLIRAKAREGKRAVLGLATGHTPINALTIASHSARIPRTIGLPGDGCAECFVYPARIGPRIATPRPTVCRNSGRNDDRV